jgi:nucleoid DNA-binding protein
LNYNQTVAAVARKLRQRSRREVREVLDVLLEVWREELLRTDGYIRIDNLGKLYVEQQTMRTPGAVKQALAQKQLPAPPVLSRFYFRFHPSESLRQALVAARESEQKKSE